MFLRHVLIVVVYTSIAVCCGCKDGSGSRPPPAATPLEDLQRSFVDLRFGMFLHFGILTYTGSWAQPNLDISLFKPSHETHDPARLRDP